MNEKGISRKDRLRWNAAIARIPETVTVVEYLSEDPMTATIRLAGKGYYVAELRGKELTLRPI